MAGTSQTLTWDDEGHLATHTIGGQSTGYVYDADGARILRSNPDGSAVAYLPGGWELARSTTGTLTGTRYYHHAGTLVAVRGATGLHWQAGDHHGTATVTIDPATLAVTKRRTMPFGAPRGTQPAWPSDKGFVGGTSDPTGLTHLGAREYDPGTGRFVSLDPVIDTGQPQQMHGYAYANNNPATLSDPTGLEPGSWCNTSACAVANTRTQTAHPCRSAPAHPGPPCGRRPQAALRQARSPALPSAWRCRVRATRCRRSLC
ncbi:MAG TPA: RHS repeat-associated core domain-containing protein [Micromonosporaceae bacterium]|nr:RHS repeat-associated core domain-containing protein [Micromonosporaceae bacterium]